MADGAATGDSARVARWVTILGVVMIVAGFLAVIAPGPAALAATIFFGAMFFVGGVAEVAHAVATRNETGFGWKLLSGIAMIVLGALFAIFPLAGIATLALLIGGLLLALIMLTRLYWPEGSMITHYDCLFFAALAIQIAMLAGKLETIEEARGADDTVGGADHRGAQTPPARSRD